MKNTPNNESTIVHHLYICSFCIYFYIDDHLPIGKRGYMSTAGTYICAGIRVLSFSLSLSVWPPTHPLPPPPIPRLLTVNRYAFLLTTPAVLLYWLAYFLVLRFETNHADDTEANIQAEHVKPSVHDDAEPLLSNTHPTGKQKHFLFSFLFSFFFFSMCHILRYSDWNLESANVLTAKQLILIMKSVFLVQCHCMKRHTRIAFLQRNGTQQQIKLMQRNREKGY